MFKHCSRLLLLATVVVVAGLLTSQSASAQYTITYGAAPGFYPSGGVSLVLSHRVLHRLQTHTVYVTPVGFPTYTTYSTGYRGYGYGAYNYSPYIYTTNYFPYTGYRTFYTPYPYRAGYVSPYGFPQ